MLIHVIKSGETLTSIARTYRVSVLRICIDNGITPASILVVGQALVITLPDIIYTVRRGDSLYKIAAAFKISVLELRQNNPHLIASDLIFPGEMLTISFRGGKRRTITIKGYAYPHINRRTLIRALPYMTSLAIFSYGFTENGELIEPKDEELIAHAYRYRTAPVMVLSSIDESGGFSSAKARRLFTDTALQNKVLDKIIAVMLRKGYVGLDSDFEYVEADVAEDYFSFLSNARSRLRDYGLTLNTDLAPKTSGDQPGLLYEAHNYGVIGSISDTVLLMTYEWGYTYGPPMAIAPIDKVRLVVQYAVSEIETNKILMGMPNYAYDWKLPFERGVTQARNIGSQEAVVRAAQFGAPIQFDQQAQTPFFEYFNAGTGSNHVVWFEDARSIKAKFDLVDEHKLLGVGYWNIMRPFAQNWALIATRYNVRKIV